jgi:hypothetical protein
MGEKAKISPFFARQIALEKIKALQNARLRELDCA